MSKSISTATTDDLDVMITHTSRTTTRAHITSMDNVSNKSNQKPQSQRKSQGRISMKSSDLAKRKPNMKKPKQPSTNQPNVCIFLNFCFLIGRISFVFWHYFASFFGIILPRPRTFRIFRHAYFSHFFLFKILFVFFFQHFGFSTYTRRKFLILTRMRRGWKTCSSMRCIF